MSDVSRETSEKLARFAALVREWSPRINLVSKASLAELEQRHIQDSAQVAELAPTARTWCDLGSGGGFPGIVVAICRPDIRTNLVESDRRKAAFLRHAARELDLNANIICERIEAVEPLGADVISARALAPLDRLIELALPHSHAGTTFAFPKGARHAEEVAEARKRYSFHIDARPSKTDNEGVILVLENIARV